MGTPARLRFSLRQSAGTYYALDNSGNIVTQSSPYYLTKGPIGAKDTALKMERSVSLAGLLRVFSTPYGYPLEGAKILRHLLYTYGKEAVAFLYIEKVNNDTWLYEDWAFPEVDFSTAGDLQHVLNVELKDNGAAAWYRAYENTTVEIPVLAADATAVEIDSPVLGQEESLILGTDGHTYGDDEYVEAHQFTPSVQSAYTASSIGTNTFPVTTKVDTATLITSEYYFYEATAAGTFEATIDFMSVITTLSWSAYPLATHSLVISIRRVNAANTVQGDYDFPLVADDFVLSGGVGTRLIVSDETLNIPVAEGDRLAFFIGFRPYNNLGTPSGIEEDFLFEPATMRVRYPMRNPESIVRGYRPLEVLQKIVAALPGGSAYTAASSLLADSSLSRNSNWDNRPYNNIFIPGDGIRGLGDGLTPDTSPKIKTSLQSFIQHWDTVQGVGIGVEGSTIRLEKLEYFFQSGTPVMDLGECSDLEVSPALDHLFTSIKVGYPNQNIDEINGRYAVNAGQEWALPAVRAPKVLELTSPYITDMYAIEALRASKSDRTTVDDAQDNEVMVIDVTDTPPGGGSFVHFPYRPQNDSGNSATGIPGGEYAYNLTLTPKRCLLRNPRIRPSLFGLTGSITFQSAERFAGLVSNLGAGSVDEKAAIAIADVEAALFKPFNLVFTNSTPIALFAQPIANLYKEVTGRAGSIALKGFIDGIRVNPVTGQPYECRLLASPDFDPQTLIR